MSSQHYNDFCCYCTGQDCKEIRKCEDTDCPFFPFRYGGLERDVEKDICEKLMTETGMIE
ncbi:unnamed protein product [marine sediment metagenome]|uniref:Uncharacterized protein n=1 Tax=marine sediment metagenome TaxID=412755 RepID=X0S6J6_9ZZZZ